MLYESLFWLDLYCLFQMSELHIFQRNGDRDGQILLTFDAYGVGKCLIFWRTALRWRRFTLYILTYSIVQSPSWEANWFAASQEIPRILRNPKVHYCTHKRPPTVPILGQPNPVHIPTSHLLEIHPNIIHPSTPKPPQRSLSLWFPHQDTICPSYSSRCFIIILLIILSFQISFHILQ